MKKMFLFAALLTSTATFAFAQDGGPGFGPQGPRFGGPGFGEAFKDGKIEIAKLPEQMPQERKDAFKAADKDGDGFLTAEEMKEIAPPKGNGPRFGGGPGFGGSGFGPQGPGFGGPGFGPQGPGFGGPGFGPQGPGFGGPGFGSQGPRFGGGPGFGPQGPRFGGPGFGEAFKDGKIEIAKLPEQMSQERKDAFKAADKDGDGFLTAEEMKEIAPPKFEKPAFVTDDQKIDVAKLTEAIKAADQNGDGFVDQNERKAAFDAAQKKYGPFFLAPFVPQPFGPQADWNRGPQRNGQGPQANWNRGPQRNGQGPQADWNRGPQRNGQGPQANWNRGAQRNGRGRQANWNRGPQRNGNGPQAGQPRQETPKAE